MAPICGVAPARQTPSLLTPAIPRTLLLPASGDTQMGMIASKRCLTTAPVLRTFDSSRRSVVTTDASEVVISAVLTQLDDEGHHHPAARESRNLTAAWQAHPPHILELLAKVSALRMFRHDLLGSGAPRPPGSFRASRSGPITRWSRGCAARSGT